MDDRERKLLPKWAQELITDLRKRVQSGNEPLLRELAELRPRMAALKARNDGLEELLRCAAKGGHITAIQITEYLEGYSLVRIKDEVEPTKDSMHPHGM